MGSRRRAARGGVTSISCLVPQMCALGLDVIEYAPNLTGKRVHLQNAPIFHIVFQRGGRCAHAPQQQPPPIPTPSQRPPAPISFTLMNLRAAAADLRLFRDAILNRHYNDHAGLVDGSSWPPGSRALSMAGQRRIDHTVALLVTAIAEGVKGDFIETGVWRGGVSFVAARALELLEPSPSAEEGADEAPRTPVRRVFLCDSFAGIPEQAAYGRGRGHAHGHAGAEQDARAHTWSILNDNSEARVRADAARFGLPSARLSFERGFFNESLPALLAREGPSLAFAVMRLDGDTYWSTYEALESLYPRLSPGGFVIIDDYVDWAGCRAAVDAYRAKHGITSPITLVPHRPHEATRGAYWRRSPRDEAAAEAAVCVGAPPGHLRIAGSFNPPVAVPAGPPGRPKWDDNLPMGTDRPSYQVFKCVGSPERGRGSGEGH